MEDVVAARARLQLALSLSPDDPAIKTELARLNCFFPIGPIFVIRLDLQSF